MRLFRIRILALPSRVLLGVIVIVMAIAAGADLRAAAQADTGTDVTSKSALGVSPAIMEHALTPGKPTEFMVQVNNVTNYPLPIKSYIRDLRLQGESVDESARARFDASQWFVIEEPDFILQPNQVRTVKGTILAPQGVSPGGHYATIFFQPLVPEEALSPSMAYINTKVGVLVFLVAKGDIKEEARVDKPLQARISSEKQDTINLIFSIRNAGNVHLLPAGKVKITDWRGHPAGEIDVPPGIVLPDTTKEYTLSWQPGSRFGKYSAELIMNIGSERVELQKTTTSFWVIPWLEIIVPGACIVVVAAVAYRTRRRWRRAWQALKTQ